MLFRTQHLVSDILLKTAIDQVPEMEFRVSINHPTGRFFYDPWEISDEYRGTIWETLYDSLSVKDKGEARIIRLSPRESYSSHADIDDRYHLNLSGSRSYLIDLDNLEMHLLHSDGIWYEMDAGRIHTATNFGRGFRYQLVIRKLLIESESANKHVIIRNKDQNPIDYSRYLFDNNISSKLNILNKNKKIKNFNWNEKLVSFDICESAISCIENIRNENFDIEIY